MVVFKIFISGFLLLGAELSFAESVSIFDVMPVRNAGLENIAIDSQITAMAGANYTRINMHLGCFSTNLRSVVNPVNEFSMVTALLDLYDSSGNLQTYQVRFPAEFLKHPPQRLYPQSDMDLLIKVVSPATGVYMKAYDNTIQLLVPHIKLVTLTSTGEVANFAEKNLTLSGVRFLQGPMPDAELATLTAAFTAAGKTYPGRYQPGQYLGFTGPLSGRTTWYVSNDTGSIDITADFPGAAYPGQSWGVNYQGFCGGFYSPLVLFFDDEFPEFSGRSSFPLFARQVNKVYWPEAHSKAYFLVLDKNSNQKVDDGSELFGDTDGFKNGFENLASFDANRDGVIDKKDPIFSNSGSGTTKMETASHKKGSSRPFKS